MTSSNDQERLMTLISQYSMGAPFVFEPEDWKKIERAKDRPDEAPDLVWLCNNCAILIFLKRTKFYNKLVKDQRKCQQNIAHNLSQANGVLNNMRSRGRILKGQNSYQRFNISIEKCKHIIILSIIECGEAIAKYHHDETIKLKVTMCATVPLSVVEEFAKSEAGVFELLKFICRLKEATDIELPENKALREVSSYINNAWENTGASKIWQNKQCDIGYAELRHFVHGMKLPIENNKSDGSKVITEVTESASLFEAAMIFNDLSLVDYLRIIVALRINIDIIKRKINPFVDSSFLQPITNKLLIPNCVEFLKLEHYDFTLYITPSIKINTNKVNSISEVVNLAKRNSRRGEDQYGPIITFFVDLGLPMIAILPRIGPSAIEIMLDA